VAHDVDVAIAPGILGDIEIGGEGSPEDLVDLERRVVQGSVQGGPVGGHGHGARFHAIDVRGRRLGSGALQLVGFLEEPLALVCVAFGERIGRLVRDVFQTQIPESCRDVVFRR